MYLDEMNNEQLEEALASGEWDMQPAVKAEWHRIQAVINKHIMTGPVPFYWRDREAIVRNKLKEEGRL